MTVCIAAIANNSKTLITVTDQMLGAGLMLADLPYMLKGKRVCEMWSASFAGNDISYVPPIIAKVQSRIKSNNAADVAQAFVTAYQEERARIAEESILSPLGLDMKSFLDLLITENSPELADLQRKIQLLDFDPVFLVSGFDENGNPHVLTIEPPGTARYYDNIGFWAIGSGAEAALSSLFHRRYSPYQTWQEALYMVAEAKFMSESSANVGKSSLINILNVDRKWTMLFAAEVEPIRSVWEKEGRPPLPENLETRIGEIVPEDSFRDLGKWRERKAKIAKNVPEQLHAEADDGGEVEDEP